MPEPSSTAATEKLARLRGGPRTARGLRRAGKQIRSRKRCVSGARKMPRRISLTPLPAACRRPD